MAELMVYEKRTCTTLREALLAARGARRRFRPVNGELGGDRAVLARPVERVSELLD
jgi:hypothetical protein